MTISRESTKLERMLLMTISLVAFAIALYNSPFALSMTCCAIATAVAFFKRSKFFVTHAKKKRHDKKRKGLDVETKSALLTMTKLAQGAINRDILWESRIFSKAMTNLSQALLSTMDYSCAPQRLDSLVGQVIWSLAPDGCEHGKILRPSFSSPTATNVTVSAPNLAGELKKAISTIMHLESAKEIEILFSVQCDDNGARLISDFALPISSPLFAKVPTGFSAREHDLRYEIRLTQFENNYGEVVERNSLVGHKTMIVSHCASHRQWIDELLVFRGATSTFVGSLREVKTLLACSKVEGQQYGAAYIDGVGIHAKNIRDMVNEIRRISPGLPLIISLCPEKAMEIMDALLRLDHIHLLIGPIIGMELITTFEQVLDHPPKMEDVVLVTGQVEKECHRPLKVLIAEDHPVNSEFAFEILNARGHQVSVVENGAEALYLFKREVFDIILMDLSMPVLDGVQTTLRMRELESTMSRYTPIIAVTANTDMRRRESIIAAGADSILNKPVIAKELIIATEEAAGPGEENSEKAKIETTSCKKRVSVPFDSEEALRHVNGNRSLLHRLISTFLSDAPQRIERLRIAVGRANVDEMHEAAHSLKGAAGYIGAHGVGDMASRLCDMGRHRCLDGAPETLSVLESEYDRLTPLLKTYMAD